MTDDAIPVGPGKIIVTWTDGTTSTYTIPADQLTTFNHTGNQVKFNSFPVGETSGLVTPKVLNFDHMRGYEKIGI